MLYTRARLESTADGGGGGGGRGARNSNTPRTYDRQADLCPAGLSQKEGQIRAGRRTGL